MYDLSAFLDETVPELIRKQLYADAFDLVCDAYDIAHHSNLLEEGGYFFDFDNDCLQYWDEIIPNADEAEKQKMYQWLSKTAERDGFLGDLVDAFPDNPYLEHDLQIIDAQIQNHTEDEDLLGHLVALRCEVMFRLGIQCAIAASNPRSKLYPEIHSKYQILKKRRGTKKARVAIARRLLTAIYHILLNDSPYRPADPSAKESAPEQRVISLSQALALLTRKGYVISKIADIQKLPLVESAPST